MSVLETQLAYFSYLCTHLKCSPKTNTWLAKREYYSLPMKCHPIWN